MSCVSGKCLLNVPKIQLLEEEQAARSIVVSNISLQTTKESVVIHFQRQKNGGGEVDYIHIPKKGAAVIVFERSEVVETVLQHSHTLEGSTLKLHRLISDDSSEVLQLVKARINFERFQLSSQEWGKALKVLKDKTEVQCSHVSNKECVLYGTFNQIFTAQTFLEDIFHRQSSVSQQLKRANDAIHQVVETVLQQSQECEPYEESGNKDNHNFEVFELVTGDLNFETVELLTCEQTKVLVKEIAFKTGVKWIEDGENIFISGSFKQVEMSRTYLQQAINQCGGIAVLSGVERKIIESQKRDGNGSQFVGEENEGDLNQTSTTANAVQNEVHHHHFHARKEIYEMSKGLPVFVGLARSQKHRDLNGEEHYLKTAVGFRKHEKVEIKRKRRNGKGTEKLPGPRDQDKEMDVVSPNSSGGAQSKEIRETYTAPRKPVTNKTKSVIDRKTEEAGLVHPGEIPTEKQDSKQMKQGSDVNNDWRQVQSDVAHMRQALDEEKRTRSIRKQELRQKETVLISTLQNTLREEQRARTRVLEELSQARITCNELEERMQNELAQIRQTLDDEIRLRDTRERELREKETIVDQLQKTLGEEQQMRTTLTERLQTEMLSSQARQQELQTKENANREQQRLLEEERQQKTALEERIRNLELQMQEERNRYLSNERELQSAVCLAQDELTEYQRRQPRDWIIQREEVVLSDNVLGKGAWGSVREGTFRGCQVAVKEIHEVILSSHNRRLFEREMSIASCCRHPNLLQFIGATNDDGSPLFVTELLDTSLRRLLSERALNHEEIVSLALDVAKGLNYLHLNKPLPIIHRDISSANVLLWRRDKCWRAKLSDYGSANFMRQYMTVNPGAIIYSAPEALTSQQSPKADVYSFGLLLCEMCVRELPVPQEVHCQISQVNNGAVRGLIEQCVKRDPEERPTMSDIIHSWNN